MSLKMKSLENPSIEKNITASTVKNVKQVGDDVIVEINDGTVWISPIDLDNTKEWWKIKSAENNTNQFGKAVNRTKSSLRTKKY